jgi:hypothetical protein
MTAMGGKRTFVGYAVHMFLTRRVRGKPRNRWKDLAWSLWLTPAILLMPLAVLPFMMDWRSGVSAIAEAWDLYALFFLLPWAAGFVAWMQGRRADVIRDKKLGATTARL